MYLCRVVPLRCKNRTHHSPLGADGCNAGFRSKIPTPRVELLESGGAPSCIWLTGQLPLVYVMHGSSNENLDYIMLCYVVLCHPAPRESYGQPVLKRTRVKVEFIAQTNQWLQLKSSFLIVQLSISGGEAYGKHRVNTSSSAPPWQRSLMGIVINKSTSKFGHRSSCSRTC